MSVFVAAACRSNLFFNHAEGEATRAKGKRGKGDARAGGGARGDASAMGIWDHPRPRVSRALKSPKRVRMAKRRTTTGFLDASAERSASSGRRRHMRTMRAAHG